MKTIHKYQVVFAQDARIAIEMPKGAEVLHLQAVGDEVFLWARVDPSQPSESLPLWLALTGKPLPEGLGEHLGTAVLYDGTFVLHVFEGRPHPHMESF